MSGFLCMFIGHRWLSHWSYQYGRYHRCARCGGMKERSLW